MLTIAPWSRALPIPFTSCGRAALWRQGLPQEFSRPHPIHTQRCCLMFPIIRCPLSMPRRKILEAEGPGVSGTKSWRCARGSALNTRLPKKFSANLRTATPGRCCNLSLRFNSFPLQKHSPGRIMRIAFGPDVYILSSWFFSNLIQAPSPVSSP